MTHAALLLALSVATATESQPTVVIVVGASGTDEYAEMFLTWARRWQAAAKTGGADVVGIGVRHPAQGTDRDALKAAVTADAESSSQELWIVMIGHGTFDGREAKFNLRGPDLSATELAEWLEPVERPVAVVNCASSSAPFINRISAPNRVVVTATKSGSEQNFARFGDYISSAIGDVSADLDKDSQTSLLEAWLMAARRTQEFYDTDGRLATEHALLDDNGDGKGTRADSFRGVRPKQEAKSESLDGYRAHQFHLVRSADEQALPAELRETRDRLELAVIRLRDRKHEFEEDEYYSQLETLLVDLAELYASSEAK